MKRKREKESLAINQYLDTFIYFKTCFIYISYFLLSEQLFTFFFNTESISILIKSLIPKNINNNQLNLDSIQKASMSEDKAKDQQPQTKQISEKIKARKSTDTLCLIVYIVFSAFYFVMAIYCWNNGSIQRLNTPYDPDGKGCGIQHAQYPYIYFPSPQTSNIASTVCVSQCPRSSDTALKCAVNSIITSCIPSQNSNIKMAIYDSQPLKNLCVPDSLHLRQQIAPGFSSYTSQVGQLLNNYLIYIIGIVFAIIFSFILFRSIRKIQEDQYRRIQISGSQSQQTHFIKILFIVNITVVIILALFLLFLNYFPSQIQPIVSYNVRIITAIVLIIIAIALIIIFCIQKAAIQSSDFMLNVSAQFLQGNKTACILLPLILFIISIFYIILWIWENICYFSTAQPDTDTNKPPFHHLVISYFIIKMSIGHLIHLLWTIFILIEISSFIVKGSACSHNQTQLPYFKQVARLLFKRHLGSVCLGGFLTLFLGLFKLIYEVLSPNMTKKTESTCLLYIRMGMKSLCCCCEKILHMRFNNWAYTLVYLSGDSYLTAAHQSFLLTQQQGRISTSIYNLILIFNIIMKGTVMFATVLVVILSIQFFHHFQEQVESPIIVMLISGLFAYLVVCFCSSIYVDSMEAIFLRYTQALSVDGIGKVKQLQLQYKQLITFKNQIQKQQQKLRKEQNPDDSQYE